MKLCLSFFDAQPHSGEIIVIVSFGELDGWDETRAHSILAAKHDFPVWKCLVPTALRWMPLGTHPHESRSHFGVPAFSQRCVDDLEDL